MIIYLGDLFHTWTKGGIWTIPLNIGYVAAYLKHKLKLEKNLDVEVKLFKDAEKLLQAIDQKKPDVIGLGFFVWNNELNKYIFNYAKEKYPSILTVGGGPRFTNINANEKGAKKFFSEVENCDVFVVNQGEKGFYEVIKRFCEYNLSINSLVKEKIPGSLVNNKMDKNINIHNCDPKIHIGENIGTLDDLNEVPSPYLTGLLDDFFEDRYMPIIETNRSCPYRCTFCAWGIGTQKLMKFDEERVISEINYISERCKNTSTLFIADANFGILERDAIFAKKIYESHVKYNFPKHVAVQWNKTRPDRILKVAKEFRSIAPVGASMQSLSEDVLTAIKRKNLTFDQILNLQDSLKNLGIEENSFTELIIGLPNETKKTHLMANKKLIDFGFEIQNYFLHLLPGTEMDEEEYRKKYFKKTFYRLFDNSYGVYNGKMVFEAQETIGETSTMNTTEFKFFRFFHFLIQMMWGKRWYYYFLVYIKNEFSIHPVDFIQKMVDNFPKETGRIKEIYEDFIKDYTEAESFETQEELVKYWSKEENFDRLKKGDYGKLNMLYTYKVILNYKIEFSDYLTKTLTEILKDKDIAIDIKKIREKSEEVIKFQNCKLLNFDEDLIYKKEFTSEFNYDFISWIKNKYTKLKYHKHPKKYKFFIPNDRDKLLDQQFSNNKSSNLNSKLRDMTVYASSSQFFYDIKLKS